MSDNATVVDEKIAAHPSGLNPEDEYAFSCVLKIDSYTGKRPMSKSMVIIFQFKVKDLQWDNKGNPILSTPQTKLLEFKAAEIMQRYPDYRFSNQLHLNPIVEVVRFGA